MSDNERVIRDFISAWSRLDPVELTAFFAEDGVYHNMPLGPTQGRDNIEALIRNFSASWTETTWDILTSRSNTLESFSRQKMTRHYLESAD